MNYALLTTFALIVAFNCIDQLQSAPVDEKLEHAKKAFPDRSEADLIRFREKMALYRQKVEKKLRDQYESEIKQQPAKQESNLRTQKPNLAAPSMSELNRNLSDFLYQGDIMLTEEQLDYLIRETDQPRRHKRQGYCPSNFPATLWINPVPYCFDAGVVESRRVIIRRAVQWWQDNTCITFTESCVLTPRIRVINGNGCYSYIGKLPQATQDLSIGNGCDWDAIIQHEFAHALGFYHGQSRVDRDNFVTVNLANVVNGYAHNFDKATSATNCNFDVPYEYGGVMHYFDTAFAVDNTQPVLIATVNPLYQKTMGNYVRPTVNDVLLMNKLYSCQDGCADSSLVCENCGFPSPRDCSKCVCAWPFAGDTCSDRAPASNGSLTCGETLTATATKQSYTILMGNDQQVTMDAHTLCTWHINAPGFNRVEVTINFIGDVSSSGCAYNGVEFREKADQCIAGYQLCFPIDQPIVLTSETNRFVIMGWSRYYWTRASFEYRFVA